MQLRRSFAELATRQLFGISLGAIGQIDTESWDIKKIDTAGIDVPFAVGQRLLRSVLEDRSSERSPVRAVLSATVLCSVPANHAASQDSV